MKTLKLKNPTKLGDYDEKYGQRFWSDSYDQDTPVMFNLMSQEDLHDGQTITAETVELAESKKGTEYHKLKKVRVGGQTVMASTANHAPKQAPKKEWQPRDDDRIVAQWAIGQAVSVYGGDLIKVEHMANDLFKMVDRVKSGSGGDATSQPRTQVEKSEPAATEDVVVTDIGDEPINLDDIPF